MTKKILIDTMHVEDIRATLINEQGIIEDFDVDTITKTQNKSNIYLARVMRVEHSLQACFVDYGQDRHGFLPFSEIHPDYFQVSPEEKKKLIHARNKDEVDTDIDPLESDNEDSVEILSDTHTGDGDLQSVRDLLRSYRIEDVIKPKQVILVQVVKEERGNKGAALTTYISLAGRYSVLMPNSNKRSSYGISRKIYKRDDRKRLRDILKSLTIPEQMTLILRTAGLNVDVDQIKQDQNYLTNLWNEVKKQTYDSSVPALIYEEGNLVKRVIRDMLQEDVSEVIIDGEEGYKEAKAFYKSITGKTGSFIKQNKGQTPLFVQYKVEGQLETIYLDEVILPSGGSIVINQTEALVAIDVNSGKSTKAKSIEETAVQTNIEAAKEIARQMRLRDLAGLVVIDFIDMDEEKNRHRVENHMRDAMRPDRAKIQIRKISALGLMELSRQRMRPSFLESSYLKCPHCRGLGVVPSVQTASVLALRQAEKYLIQEKIGRLVISVLPEVAIYLLNQKRNDLHDLETKYETTIVVIGDESIVSIQGFIFEKMKQNESAEKYLLDHKPLGRPRQETEKRKAVVSLVKTFVSPKEKKQKKTSSFWDRIFTKEEKEAKEQEVPKKPNFNKNHKRRHYPNKKQG
ncbi:MAG: Rne/Rng family ribonuclease [Alphaproteobacteria bacterium]|nr:Rne/Rng family ribonuclease [Alphaproteobacteria bacterium]